MYAGKGKNFEEGLAPLLDAPLLVPLSFQRKLESRGEERGRAKIHGFPIRSGMT
jgi:hypothetical protein